MKPDKDIPEVTITSSNSNSPNTLPPPRIQRQNTLINSDPSNFQALLAKDTPDKTNNVNNDATKETLKVPVAELFPEKLTEQNYSRRKKTPASSGEPVTERSKSPVRKLSTCLEPHEPVIDSLPAPVPLSPSPRPSLTRNISINSNSSFDAFSKQSGILGRNRQNNMSLNNLIQSALANFSSLYLPRK